MEKRIPIDRIGYDPRYYPRVNGSEDWLTVHRYTDTLKADDKKEFPPIHVARATGKPYEYILLDGVHRTKSYHNAKRETIPAIVETLPQSKWFARSAELNVGHGRPLDSGDKAWIAIRLEEDGYTIGQAAALLQMRVESLEKIKADHVVKIKARASKKIPIGRSNRQVGEQNFGFLKSAFKDHAGHASAQGVLDVQGAVTSRTTLNILDSCIAALEAGVDMTDEEVVARIERMRVLMAKL
jgi:hypothetical protein